MVAKDHQQSTGSTKVEVGEIDTRAPFQSVKDAVNLFGEGAFSGEKHSARMAKPHSVEVLFSPFFILMVLCLSVCILSFLHFGHISF